MDYEYNGATGVNNLDEKGKFEAFIVEFKIMLNVAVIPWFYSFQKML